MMMNNRSAFRNVTTSVLLGVLALGAAFAYGQEKPYTEGSVWVIEMVRVKPGMLDVYMRDVLPLRKKFNEEAKKQGLLLSSHVLSGTATGRDDFDVLYLDEVKNWAAFDGMSAKYDAIAKQIMGGDFEKKNVDLMTKRIEVREIMGDKVMQELIPK